MKYSNLDIATLLHAAESGDSDAIEEILSRFDPLIISKSRIHGHVNEDMVQDVRAAFFKSLTQLN